MGLTTSASGALGRVPCVPVLASPCDHGYQEMSRRVQVGISAPGLGASLTHTSPTHVVWNPRSTRHVATCTASTAPCPAA